MRAPYFGQLCALLYLPTWLGIFLPTVHAAMTVKSFDGAVTVEELLSFNNFIKTQTPASDNTGNNWAQGHSGEAVKALGLIYSMANDPTTLDQMIRYCDVLLSERNDLAAAPLGQRVIWTGKIDLVWPNNFSESPLQTGGEQGDPVGHLASCAHLILKTKELHGKTVPIGDPHNYGQTYLSRAQTYLKQADNCMKHHILSSLLDLSRDKKMYFSTKSPYKRGKPVPWNQQMMMNYALQNLCDAHRLLGDDAALLAEYKSIINASLEWFFKGGGSKMATSRAGSQVYNWGYAMPDTAAEDSNHGSLDVAGFARAYITGDYGITAAQMKIFGNTFIDVMTLGPKNYAGTVDGTYKSGEHAEKTSYVRGGYLFLAEFRPDAYASMMKGAGLEAGKSTKAVDVFSRFLWVKNQRHLKSVKL